jgi:hypothetical protein
VQELQPWCVNPHLEGITGEEKFSVNAPYLRFDSLMFRPLHKPLRNSYVMSGPTAFCGVFA